MIAGSETSPPTKLENYGKPLEFEIALLLLVGQELKQKSRLRARLARMRKRGPCGRDPFSSRCGD